MIWIVVLLTALTVLIAHWLKAMAATWAENARKARASVRRKRILLILDDKWEWRGYRGYRPPVAYR